MSAPDGFGGYRLVSTATAHEQFETFRADLFLLNNITRAVLADARSAAYAPPGFESATVLVVTNDQRSKDVARFIDANSPRTNALMFMDGVGAVRPVPYSAAGSTTGALACAADGGWQSYPACVLWDDSSFTYVISLVPESPAAVARVTRQAQQAAER